jgi:nucleoside-triphosphatase THEP1
VVIITGAIGVGKTTVCRKLIEIARNQGYSCGGILTYKTVDESIVIEDVQSGEREVLASSRRAYDGPSTARYCFNPRGIDFGIQAIDRGISAELLVIDEIGQLELRQEGFVRVIELIKAGKIKHCVLVIRKELLDAFSPWFPATPLVLETTVDNRNQLAEQVASVLLAGG